MQTNGGVQMRVVVVDDGDDDAVKFAERLTRFWRMNFTFRCTFTNEEICAANLGFFVWTRRF
jgi:hypothetical protein